MAYVSDEVEIIVGRENGRIATEAILLQAAAGSIMSEEVGRTFADLVESLTGE